MPSGTGRLISDIQSFVSRHDQNYNGWYIGVTTDPLTRLLEEHQLNVNVDLWLCGEAFSDKEANFVLRRFVEELGMQGHYDDSDKGRFVYAYRISDHTRP